MPIQPAGAGCFWNFFRHRVDIGVWCAVPETYPVPGFLHSGEWGYVVGGCSVLAVAPYRSKTLAREGARLNGFYLFHHLPA